MNWWTWVVAGAKSAGNGVGHGLKWAWDHSPIMRITTGLLKYTLNTTFQVLQQGLALKTAIPALIYKPESRKIFNGMIQVAVKEVLPLVGLNAINNVVQTYGRSSLTGYPHYTRLLYPRSLWLIMALLLIPGDKA